MRMMLIIKQLPHLMEQDRTSQWKGPWAVRV
jgi:hypothetical protein